MSGKHTPGPWAAIFWDERVTKTPHWTVDCNLPDVLTVALISDRHSGYAEDGEDEANAYLIAAAPELLAVAKEAEAMIHSEYCTSKCHPTCDRISAAIAKAEGERQ